MDSRTVTISLDEYNVLIGNDERITAAVKYISRLGREVPEKGKRCRETSEQGAEHRT